MRVLRLTQHEIQPAQLDALKQAYGPDVEIVTVSKTVADVDDIRQVVAEHGANVLEAVLPLPLIAEAVGPRGVGIPVIRAVMNRQIGPHKEVTFTFDHYEVVEKVEVVTRPLL